MTTTTRNVKLQLEDGSILSNVLAYREDEQQGVISTSLEVTQAISNVFVGVKDGSVTGLDVTGDINCHGHNIQSDFNIGATNSVNSGGDMNCGHDLHIAGDSVSNRVFTNGDMTCGHDLHIAGDSVSNRVFTNGDMTCGHDLHIAGDSVSNRVFTNGDMTCGGNLNVTGDIKCRSLNLPGDIECHDIRCHNLVSEFIAPTGSDCAESFDVDEPGEIEPGTVMAINENGFLMSCRHEYDKRVAGIISGAGLCKPGIILGNIRSTSSSKRALIALTGKVYCKVDATHSPIEVGDLLTTSQTKGHAMKAEDSSKAFGAVIGKALGPMKDKIGLIPVLVALQ